MHWGDVGPAACAPLPLLQSSHHCCSHTGIQSHSWGMFCPFQHSGPFQAPQTPLPVLDLAGGGSKASPGTSLFLSSPILAPLLGIALPPALGLPLPHLVPGEAFDCRICAEIKSVCTFIVLLPVSCFPSSLGAEPSPVPTPAAGRAQPGGWRVAASWAQGRGWLLLPGFFSLSTPTQSRGCLSWALVTTRLWGRGASPALGQGSCRAQWVPRAALGPPAC